MKKITQIILPIIVLLMAVNLSLSYLASSVGEEISTQEAAISQLSHANLEIKNQIVHQSTLDQIQAQAKKLGFDTRLQLTSLPTSASLASSR